jgi:hypothetical protein
LQIYQAALPSAIGKRDFSRIETLASIGVYCGSGLFSSGESFPWNKQIKFVSQVRGFVTNAKMWCILSRHNVSFDPALFTQTGDASSTSMQGYCEKLIWNASLSTDLDPMSILSLATSFAKVYNVGKYVPASVLIQFLLSAPGDSFESKSKERKDIRMNDIRRDLTQVAKYTEQILSTMPVINQSKVLRKCIMSLEESVQCGQDYDRHAMVLALYQECLHKLSAFMTSETRKSAHAQESDRIERRLNAIIILSSIFDEKYQPEKKPDYTQLFSPLPIDPSQVSAPQHQKHIFLGQSSSQNVFDPLTALHDALADDATNNAMAASLSPLCSLLGLPSGYIHARALVVNFGKMKQLCEALPPPESSVCVVAKKLSTAGDRAELSWWSASQYNNGSTEQLKCLDLAYANATLAAEQLEASKGIVVDSEELGYAIERVKRIDVSRAMLSDHIIINDVLARNSSTPDIVKSIYKSIIQKVQSVMDCNDYMPERLVKDLLVEGSMAAAQASLGINNPFTTSHFRSLAILVHDACRLLSTRYSHINIGRCARIVTRRWLVHGDDITNSGSANDACETDVKDIKPVSNGTTDGPQTLCIDEESEVTAEFVMDMGKLNISSGDHAWSHQNFSKGSETGGIKSSEEPSVFCCMSSQREVSESNFSRAALRIAFLMCFAQDYHQSDSDQISDEGENENADVNMPKTTTKRDVKARTKASKCARQKVNCFEGDLALAHAKELLGIVFAKQGCTVASTFAFILEDSRDGSFSMHEEEKDVKNKALSFAMRHRALRVASILCPYEVLVRVILEEGYSSEFDDAHLVKIAFGSFLAMEIEAMGLSLPHSDLAQLSTMHFPSYARTLWRNNGGISAARLGGRLHLLILELAVNHDDTLDWELLELMFSEITRNELPRSLLLACECAVQSKAIDRAASLDRKDVILCISNATKKIFEGMSHEIDANTDGTIEASECSSLVDRLLQIIDKLNDVDAIYFVEAFAALEAKCKERRDLGQVMSAAAMRIASHLFDPVSYSKVSSAIESLRTDGPVRYSATKVALPPSACVDSIQRYENSFAYFR